MSRRLSLAATALVCVLFGCGRGGGGGGDEGETSEPLEVLAMFGGPGLSPGRFDTPRAIDTDGKTLWIVDKGQARVQRLDPATGRCLQWWPMPRFNMGRPCGLTIGPSPEGGGGRALWVADTHCHRVMVYALPELPAAAGAEEPGPLFAPVVEAMEPRLITTFGSYGTGPGEFIYLTDVAIKTDAGGAIERVYVSEYGGNDRVSVFGPDLKFRFSFGRFGAGDSAERIEFDRPQCIEIDRGRGELLVTDTRNHRLGRFTLDGGLIAWIGAPERVGKALGEFTYPWAVLPLGDGTALVTEHGNCRVQRVELESGRGLWAAGRPGRNRGGLAEPWATAVLDGKAYTLDTGNHRVVVWRAPGGGAKASRAAGGGGG